MGWLASIALKLFTGPTLDGKSLSHWAEKTGLKKRTLDSRLRAGWSSNQILNTVPNHGNKHQGFFL